MAQYNYLLNSNARHRVFTGVEKFHRAGYYGNGIFAATGESWDIDKYNPHSLVEIPFGSGIGTGHAIMTAATFFQVAPHARLAMLPTESVLSGTDPDTKSYDRFVDKAIPYIKKYGITSMFNSFGKEYDTITGPQISVALNSVKDTFKCIYAMGNYSGEKYNRITDIPEVFGAAAYEVINTITAKPVAYSSKPHNTSTFAAPSNIYIDTEAISIHDKGTMFMGTSCAAPWLCGMVCLIDEFFIDKTGRPLSRDAMHQFLFDHCVAIGDYDSHKNIGNGAVVLPNPENIKIDNYYEETFTSPILSIEREDTMDSKMTTIRPNKYTQIDIIPYKIIESMGFDLCEQPKETLSKYYMRQKRKPDVLINGGLFNMNTGENIMAFIHNGQLHGDAAGYRGIGIKMSEPGKLAYGIATEGGWKDFMSCFPMLVMDGKPVPKDEYYGAAGLNYNTARQSIGFRDDAVIIITVDFNPNTKEGGMKFEELTGLFLNHGATFAMNLDGGGSVRKMHGEEVVNVPTENRAVDNVFYVNIKEGKLTPFQAGKYTTTCNVPVYACADETTAKVFTIPADETVEVTVVMNSLWGLVRHDYQSGFMQFDGSNIIPYVEKPVFVPGEYSVNVSSSLNVRSGPGTEFEKAGNVLKDEVVIITEETNGWGKVLDPAGYVSMKYLNRIKDYTPKENDILEKFTDNDLIGDYARDAVRELVKLGIFAEGDRFRPKQACTREELAVVVSKLISLK